MAIGPVLHYLPGAPAGWPRSIRDIAPATSTSPFAKWSADWQGDHIVPKAAALPIPLITADINPLTPIRIAWGTALEDVARHYLRCRTAAVAAKPSALRPVPGARFDERSLGSESGHGHFHY